MEERGRSIQVNIWGSIKSSTYLPLHQGSKNNKSEDYFLAMLLKQLLNTIVIFLTHL